MEGQRSMAYLFKTSTRSRIRLRWSSTDADVVPAAYLKSLMALAWCCISTLSSRFRFAESENEESAGSGCGKGLKVPLTDAIVRSAGSRNTSVDVWCALLAVCRDSRFLRVRFPRGADFDDAKE